MEIYIDNIKESVIFFPLVALIISLPFFLWAYRKYGAFTLMRALILYSLSFYLLTAYFLVILPLPSFSEVAALTTPRMDLIPGSFITIYLNNKSLHSITEPVFNLLMLIPLGIYCRYYFQFSWKKTVLLAFCVSLFFEVTQLTGLYGIYPRSYRLFSVDDLLLNTLGGLTGYGIAPLLMKILPSKEEIDEKSYEKGETVSLFRRFFALIIDLIVLSIILGLISYFIQQTGIIPSTWDTEMIALLAYSLIIFIYFVLLCYILKGQTIGKMIVKIRVIRLKKPDRRPAFLSLLVRYSILYYIIMPVFYLFLYLLQLTGTVAENRLDFILGEIVVIFLVCIILIANFIYAFISKKHRLIYESMSGTKVVSTIKVDELMLSNDQ